MICSLCSSAACPGAHGEQCARWTGDEIKKLEARRARTASELDALRKGMASKVASYVGTIDGLEKKLAHHREETERMREQWAELQNRCDIACEERDCLRAELVKAHAMALGSLAAAEVRSRGVS